MAKKPDTDFVIRYTNKDIVERIAALENKIDSHLFNSSERSDTNRKLIYASFAFTMFVLGLIIKHYIGG